ncbi:hypothetical protein ANCDUO_26191 [Ancylostoma duodenale]|uniref:Uncharacterized protein n=1 Tax=Ancylostoma duodenale TaxID=51022 RepID=A0A0C2C2M6_9BILA|nr:hypothetical protein ANCDUO_26191 [Ancylostoma duodenale]
MAQIAQFNELQELIFDSCNFPVSESQLIRGMAPSFKTLSRLEISDNHQVLDSSLPIEGFSIVGALL